MGQLGFYDLDSRLKALSAKGDPLEALEALVPFESFRAEIEAVVRLAPEERKSNAGRKPFDAVMMFKILVLQTLYNLADEQIEYQIRDRLSFMRFLGLGLEDVVPDATTVWLFREALSRMATSMPRATSRAAVRSSTRPSSARPSSTTPAKRTRRSRRARRRRVGRKSEPRMRRRTKTRAGPRRTTKASTATRTTSASTASTS